MVTLTGVIPDGLRAVYFARADAIRMAKGRPVEANEELWERFILLVRRRGITTADWAAEAENHIRNAAKYEAIDAGRCGPMPGAPGAGKAPRPPYHPKPKTSTSGAA